MEYLSKEEIREKYRIGNDLSKIHSIPPEINEEEIDNANPKRVAVYCRVSTDGISQTTSFELQKKFYLKYVKDHPGWKLVGMYSDEGISATSIKNRIGLQMLIKDACDGKIDLIVIKSISRFCRNLRDCITILKLFKNLKKPVEIYFETERISTLDPAMDLVIVILSVVAEEESKKKSEAITSAYRQKYSEGFFNVPQILGYKRIGVNSIDIDEEEAKTVRLIYDMYLSGFSAEDIANTLIELKRKKHTHIYIDGRVKEGKCDWNKESVERVFDNEKRCGDVLAQKTYTYDCIEHIVRKNNKNVEMYYAIDQHPSIVSRDDLYLALKLKKANKNGWKFGVQTIKTYMSGPLKGFVRVIPAWNGYQYYDYARASLEAYGFNIPEKSLYPEYVDIDVNATAINFGNSDVSKEECEHYYSITEEEFEQDIEFTDEELILLEDNVDPIYEAISTVANEINNKKIVVNQSVDVRLFSHNEKPTLLIDKNGLFFSRACNEKLKSERIEIYYNPIYGVILVGSAAQNEENALTVKWIINGKMHRCSVEPLCNAFYCANNWNRDYKYKIIGKKIKISGKEYLEFKMNNPIIRLYTEKKEGKKEEIQREENVVEKIIKEFVSSEDYFSEIEEIKENILYEELVKNVDTKSRAVYFCDDRIENRDNISIEDFGVERYSPDFISMLKKKKIAPIEGWNYLKGVAEINKYYIDVLSPEWNQEMNKKYDFEMIYDETEDENFKYLGWPTQYAFPNKDNVAIIIENLKKEINQKEEKEKG